MNYNSNYNSIIYIEDKIFYEYRDYIMNCKKELFYDVIKSSHSKIYNIIFYITAFLFIVGFIDYYKQLITL